MLQIFVEAFFYVCLFLKIPKSKLRESISKNHQTKNEKVAKKCTYLRKIMPHFLKFLP